MPNSSNIRQSLNRPPDQDTKNNRDDRESQDRSNAGKRNTQKEMNAH